MAPILPSDPAGGDDQTYALLVSQVAEPDAPTLLAGTVETGSHDSIESFRFDPATLSTGLVDVTFAKDQHPSVLDLATAVRDSGFTVVSVEGM